MQNNRKLLLEMPIKRRSFLKASGMAFAYIAAPVTLRANAAAQSTASPIVKPNMVWDRAKKQQISTTELIGELVKREHILIGERHGFEPHQKRETFVLQALADLGRYPALALEMLRPEQMPVVDAYRRRHPEYAAGLGVELEWASTGWPDWHYYEPLFETAFVSRLPLLAADLSTKEKDDILQNGSKHRPIEDGILESWKQSMLKAHCGLISDERADKLALLQWSRDLSMARAVQQKVKNADGTVLIAGRAHTRSDRGIPKYLGPDTTELRLIEFEEGKLLLSQYENQGAEGEPESGYLWFTNKSTQRNACDRLTGKSE